MSISEIKAFLKETPSGILQLGAYDGEDKKYWDEWGVSRVKYVEPNPELFEKLKLAVGEANAFKYAVCDKDGLDLEFNLCYSLDRTNMGCSSLLEPKEILRNPYLESCGKITVRTTTIDELLRFNQKIDFLVMDIQGMELVALFGAAKSLPKFKGILTEFTTKSFYDGDCTLVQLDQFLSKHKFKRVITKYATDENVWGDALYIKEN